MDALTGTNVVKSSCFVVSFGSISFFMGSFLLVVFHRCKANSVDCQLAVCRRKTDGLVKGEAVRRGIKRNRMSGEILPHSFEQFSPNAETLVFPVHKEKADMTLFFPDAQHTHQLFLVKRAIIAYPGEIGIIIQALFEFLCSLRCVVRGLKIAEHSPRKLQRLSSLRALQRTNLEEILPEFVGGGVVAVKSALKFTLFHVLSSPYVLMKWRLNASICFITSSVFSGSRSHR